MKASRPRPNILLGIALVARGRAEGLAQFGDTRQAFIASLLPLIAVPLIGEVLMVMHGEQASLTGLLATVCALLAPPVLSHAVARRWDREAQWTRFAVASNWCQWAIPAVAAVLLLVISVLIALGMPNEVAGRLLILALAAYGVWMQWFLARRALDLRPLRATAMIVLVNLGTAAVIIAPLLVAALLAPPETVAQ